jgi:ribosomal protein S18 acetylase RimI-like enzyme
MGDYEDYDFPDNVIEVLEDSFPESVQDMELEITTCVTSSQIDEYVDVMETTISTYYEAREGLNWTKSKKEEMKTKGMVFISYREPSGKLGAFLSMLLTSDDWGLVIYLYEVHVCSKFHGKGVGKKLMDSLHLFSCSLQHSGIKLSDTSLAELTSIKLTVFSDNESALKFYEKLGYMRSDESPEDRKLRSGKIIKPDYYILFKSL